MSLRERNNLARKKCYEKQLERIYALDYEFFICDYHREVKDEIVYHWKYIPEGELEKAGFINDYNKVRLNRIQNKKEGNNVREYGLDGLSLDKDGNYHGLQAKYWKSRKLTADDLGTFILVSFSFASKNPLSKGFLYHTCDLQIDLRDYIKTIPNIETCKLEFKTKKKIEPETDETKFTLYPPQQEALVELKKGWEGVGLISMPCALGKTVLLGNYLRDLNVEPSPQIMILSPLRVLTKQMLDRIKPFIPDYFELLVDSDEGGTTDEEYILEMMEKHKCLISITYESFENIFLDKELDNVLLVIDEAHNLGSWDKINEKIEELDQVLLLTATPTNDMFDITGFETIYDYPMREAIDYGYVTDYLINLPIVINDKVDIDIPTELNDLDEDLTMKSLFLISGMLERGSQKCIVYCGSIEECKAFNEIFEKVCSLYHGIECWTNRINKDTGKKKRDDILKDFQENEMKLSVLSSVRILNEGVNIVKCDSVFITKVNKNEITAVQRMCRANRLDKENPNKIANCFIWADDLNKTVSMLQYLKDNDETQFFNKIKSVRGNYERKSSEEETKKEISYEKTVSEFVKVKCMSFEEIQLERAKGIVERGILRESNGLNKIPKQIKKPKNNEEEQEYRDAVKLGCWKKALKGKKGCSKCSDEVKNYLDENLTGWRDEMDEKALQDAKDIVKRGILRENKGLNKIPRWIMKPKNDDEEQEYRDAIKLGRWKQALKGKGHQKCSDEVKNYLDEYLTGWRDEIDFNEKAIQDAKDIVERGILRENQGLNKIPRQISKPKNNEEKQERKDAQKLGKWKQALKGKGHSKCNDEVKNYLDENLTGWRDEIDKKAIQDAKDIVERGILRENQGLNKMPRFISKPKNDEEEKEYRDAVKLGTWKQALKGKGTQKCSDEVKNYLDENLTGWRDEMDEKAIQDAKDIVKRGILRENKGLNKIPRKISKPKNDEEKQEIKDSQKLGNWKTALKGKGYQKCSDEVKNYLDENLTGWRDELDEKAIQDAKDIVERGILRENQGLNKIPRWIMKPKNDEEEKEYKDAVKLGCWKKALKGKCSHKCSDEVKNYLDKNLTGWR